MQEIDRSWVVIFLYFNKTMRTFSLFTPYVLLNKGKTPQ